MKKVIMSLLAGVLLAGIAVAQTSTQTGISAAQNSSVSSSPAAPAQAQSTTAAGVSQQTPAGSNSLQAGNVIYAELGKSVDAKKAKEGDEVVAKTSQAVVSQGKVVIPRGSKLIGHVTTAKAHTKEQAHSELGIAFDRAELKDGSQIPLAASIQAISAPVSASPNAAETESMPGMGAGGGTQGGGSPSYGGGGGMRSAGGGAMNTAGAATGTVGRTAGNTAGNVAGTATGAADAAGSGRLNAASRGVVGLSGLNLSASATNSTQGSLITSDSKNVKLDSGTELVLKVNQ
jgi:hypothetical protein